MTATLANARVRLSTVTPNDYPWLYDLHAGPAGHRGRFAGATPSPEAFVETLWHGTFCQYMVLSTETNERIGLVSAYNAHRGLHATIGALSDPAYDGTGWILRGVQLFVKHLFERWPFHKLYAEVRADHYDSIASGAGHTFEIEGRYHDRFYLDGGHVDQLHLAIWRDTTTHDAEQPET